MSKVDDLIDDLELIKCDAGRRITDPKVRKRYKDIIRNAVIMLRRLSKNSWIPCSEKMPDEPRKWYDGKGDVIHTMSEIVFVTCISDDGRYIITDGVTVDGKWSRQKKRKIIAWMPIPKPYHPCTTTEEWKSHIKSRFERVE